MIPDRISIYIARVNQFNEALLFALLAWGLQWGFFDYALRHF